VSGYAVPADAEGVFMIIADGLMVTAPLEKDFRHPETGRIARIGEK
jgi:hypothetical protein